MNNISTICRNHQYLRGFTPSPTSFFVLKQRTKQENSSQNDRQRALLQRRNFRQSGTSLLAEISYVAAFTATAAPRFGTATARCFVTGLCYSIVAIFFYKNESKCYGWRA
jgi:hypothetical protein